MDLRHCHDTRHKRSAAQFPLHIGFGVAGTTTIATAHVRNDAGPFPPCLAIGGQVMMIAPTTLTTARRRSVWGYPYPASVADR